jgi:uncharacterized SAM-binding protein YcdF (DUF218 family)
MKLQAAHRGPGKNGSRNALYKPSRAWSIAAVVGLVALIAAGLVARVAGTSLVLSRPLAEPDAILSLASHEWERLPLTIALARQHPQARVLLTLPKDVNRFNCHDCADRVGWLTKSGISADRIEVLPIPGSGTYGEAVATRRYADTHQGKVQRLLVVTSPYHTRRALAVFARVFDGSGVRLGMVPATATSPAQPQAWWRTPYDRWYVRHEWAATVYYALRYGVLP